MKITPAPKASQERLPVAPTGVRSMVSGRAPHNILDMPRDVSRVDCLTVMPTLRPNLGFE
ncbi:hypothetical protein [Deinococcus yavapaiensis]|uniref:Uncharacterized protein n=1 Tax=Deinococcus yavapaiensis KR-236 TaxID=694435 RepID=A0A318SA06_9DEIO|nr:hypothetical protein [Deinococcus yavapaiensis]PYE54890.1 hypothetical protein DES52_104161 [Deinococcus yavapaiensis KR-236]